MKKIVNVVEELLGGEVYHWHSKVTAKAAKEGGAWEWHQDYGYWYNHGCLYPDMMSVMVALDKSTKENGCLQVLKGSHQIGRIDHIKMVKENGDLGQVCADQERIKWAETKHENIYCEMEPGDALFFHGNTLHGSGANKSEMRRWALLFCYNTASNNPFIETHQPFYNQINKAEDNYIIENGVTLGDGSENFQSTYTKKK
jgi:ectoine hydroxylase-related dioxygenase (phytanoyl-CoA dioxygenase family)